MADQPARESRYTVATPNQWGNQVEVKPWPIIRDAALVLLAISLLFGSFRIIGVGQVGVVTRLGNVNREMQSGFNLKIPFVETVHKFDIKTQKDQAEASAASQDLQDVQATVVTNYHIEQNKVGELYRTVGVDYKARIIDPAIQESIKASTAKFPIGELITKRAEVKELALKALQSRLAFRGIIVEDISLTNFEFSAAYKNAITQKQVAEQQAQQAAFLAEKAKNEANATIATATGQSEAQRLLRETANDQTLALRTLEVEQQAIAKWNGVMPSYNGAGNLLFNIPSK